jgi:hypothetical protein
MSYQPEAFEVLAERAFKAIQDAHNSGYILGNENAEARIIKLLEAERWVQPDGMAAGGTTYLPVEHAIALIKGDDK